MNCDHFQSRIVTGVQNLHPYQPGKPIEELQRELGISTITKLASNENPLGASIRAIKAATQASFELGRYPDGSAFLLRQTLSEFLDVPPANLMFGNGSNDVLDLIARCFLSSGDNSVFFEHSFAVYAISTKACGASINVVPALNHDRGNLYAPDVDSLVGKIDENTKIVFLANPNNPTGHWLQNQEIVRLLNNIPPKVIVVIDEAYAEYIDDVSYQSALPLLSKFENLIVTRTFSKAYGLAALRLGYAVANAGLISVLNRVRQPFNCNTIAQTAAIAAIKDQGHVERSLEWNKEGLGLLKKGLADRGVATLPSLANFVSAILPKSIPVSAFYEDMLRQGVIVRPVENYGMANCVRISVGMEEDLEHLFTAMDNVCG